MPERDEIAQLLDRTVSPHPKFLGILSMGGLIFLVVGLVFFFGQGKTSTQSSFKPNVLGVTSTLPPFPTSQQLEEKYKNSSSDGAVISTIKINSASSDEIDSLPGIGSARAQKIIQNRPYTNADEFKVKTGLSQSLVDKILPYVSFQ